MQRLWHKVGLNCSNGLVRADIVTGLYEERDVEVRDIKHKEKKDIWCILEAWDW